MKKLAVIFPGTGYHTDKPLLFYSKKLAKQYGYDVVEVPYKDLFKNVTDPEKKLESAFYTAFEQTEELLKNVSFENYEQLLFISKSIGTVVASAYAQRHHMKAAHILYTPVESTFSFVPQQGIVFHGTADPMADTQMVQKECQERKMTLYIVENGNHSLETGNVLRDLEILRNVMEQTEKYLSELNAKKMFI